MAGRSYSAGRIFLDVIPSFRGVIRETEREVEKLRRQVEDDNAEAAEKDEKRQGKVRTRERVKAEKEAGDAAAAEQDRAWKRMTREQRRQAALAERERRRDERLARRRSLDGEVKKLDEIARLTAKAYADQEKSRRAHEKRLAEISQRMANKAAQDMWNDVLAAEKKRLLEREKMRREAEVAEEKLEQQRLQRAKRRLEELAQDERKARADRQRQAAADMRKFDAMQEREQRAADVRAEKRERERARRFSAIQLDYQREMARKAQQQMKLQGGRMGQELRKALDKTLLDLPTKVDIDADTRPAMQELGKLRARIEALRSKRIGVDISAADAFAELRALEVASKRLDRRRIDIDVRTNAKGVNAILRDQITVMKAAGRGAADLGDRHKSGRDDARDAANAFRLFNIRILAMATLLPMAVPALAALAAGLAALIPLAAGAGAGLGVMIMGLVGIGPAVKALSDVQQNAAKDALAYSKTMRNAGRAVRDAQQGVEKAELSAGRAAADAAQRVRDARRGVTEAAERGAEQVQNALRRVEDAERSRADAVESAAEQIQNAQRRVEDSERRLSRAQRDSADAQRDLTDARADAEEQMRDMAMRAAGGALAERQARLDLARAKAAYIAVSQDGSSTREEKEQSSIDLGRAELDLEQTIADNRELAEQRAEADRVGIEGSEQVLRAKERINDAAQAELDAERDLAEAREDRVKTERDAARSIADAERDLADARTDAARTQVEAAEMIADAQAGVTEALAAQQEVAADNATALRDANERLMDAQEAYQEALTQTGELGSSSMQKLQEAMDNLSPAGQRLALFIWSLADAWKGLRFAAQEGIAPGMQEALGTLMRPEFMDDYESFLYRMGKALGKLTHEAAHALIGPQWRPFFEMLDTLGIPLMETTARIFGNLALFFANIAVAFAPFSLEFGAAMERITLGWAEWAGNLATSERFQQFLEYVKTSGGAVVDMLVAFGDALLTIGKGLAPYADIMVYWATEFFEMIARTDPKIIGLIVAGLLALVVAIQLASGAMALRSGIGMFFATGATGAFSNPVALITLAVVGLTVALAALYVKSETFRDMVDQLKEKLRELRDWIWENREMLLKAAGAIAIAVASFAVLYGVFQIISKVIFYARFAMLAFNLALKAMGVTAIVSMGWFLLIVAGLAALVAGIIWAWNNHEGFRNFIIGMWEGIKDAAAFVVDWFVNSALPWLASAWDTIWAALLWTWENVGMPIWREFTRVAQWAADLFMNSILPILTDGWNILWGVIEFVWLIIQRAWETAMAAWAKNSDWIMVLLRGIGAFFLDLYENGVRPTFELIGNIIEWVFENVIEPVFRNVSKAIDTLVEAFRSGESLIASIWAGISDGLAGPIEFSVRFINDNMIDPINNLLTNIGLEWQIPNIPDVKIPRYTPRDRGLTVGTGRRAGSSTVRGMYATGGVMDVLPGYSPGVDNYRFSSPIGDILLGGGEGILRPEVTAVLGPEWIRAINDAAMAGGQSRVRRELGAYANGGVVDWGSLPRAPRTDFVDPPKVTPGKALWEMFTNLIDVLRNPRREVGKVISKLSTYLPYQDTFVGKWLAGAMDKLGGLVGGKVEESITVGEGQMPVGTGPGRAGAGLPWAALWRLVKGAAPEAVMTSNYRPGARTRGYGNLSMHGLGRAIDIIPASLETYFKVWKLLPWTEALFSPANGLQLRNGSPYFESNPRTRADHWDHIHLAFDKGGIVPSFGDVFAGADNVGLYDDGGILNHGDIGLNLSGKPEAVLTNDEYLTLRRLAEGSGGGNTYEANLTTLQGATAAEVAEELMWEFKGLQRRGSSRTDLH